MKAVNLIPVEERRGGGAGAAGRSGGAAYIFLGALAVLVLLTGVYVVTGRSLNDKKAELSSVTAEAQQAEAQAAKLGDYTKFAALRASREQTVTQLAATRFDWSFALREVARTMPENAWLTDLVGTVAPDVQLEGASGVGSSIRSKVAAPAIQVSGCTTSQSSVSKMIARMRLIDGVQRVSLVSSAKAEATAGSGAGVGSGGGDCRNGSDRFPKFELVVFYEPKGATPAAGTSPSAQPAAATAPATGTTPANGTTTTPAGQGTTPSAQPAAATTPSSTPQPASGGTTP